MSGSPAPPGSGSRPTFARVRAPGGRRAPGRDQLHDRGGIVVGVGEPSADEAVAGGGPTEHGRDDRLRPGFDDLDDPAVACHRRLDGLEGSGNGGRLPAPRHPQGATGERVERQQRRRLATEHPRRAVVRDPQPVEARAHRWLADDEPDTGRRSGPAVGVRVVAQHDQAARATEGDHRGRRALAEAAQVLADPCLDRAGRARFEALDEATDQPERFLEGLPRVAFAEGDAALRADVAGRHAQRAGSPRLGGQPARRQDRVEERETQRGQDGRGAQVALDAFEDGAQTDELAIRVQVEQLVGQVLRSGHDREARQEVGAHRLGTDIGGGPFQVVGVERRLAQLRPTALVATDHAAVVAGDRPGPTGDPRLVVDRPRDLVDDQGPATGRAARREHVTDRDLEAGCATRRGGHPLEGGVEVADVGRPQDDLSEHPGERRRFERDRQALPVDGGACHPPAPTEQVGDDVAGSRVRFDPGGHHRGRRGGRDPVEDRKREARPGIEGSTSGHRSDASRRAVRLADGRHPAIG